MGKTAVRYFSRGGNTKKLAEAVAKAAGIEAKAVSEPLDGDTDILFLGSAPYGFDVDEEVKKFISGLNVKVGRVVNFSTSAVVRSTRKYLEKPLAEKGIPLSREEFACRGSFMMLHKGRPNDNDLKAAAEFVKKIIT